MRQTILATGLSGFIAAYVVHHFVEAGFKDRRTLHSESSAEKVKQAYTKYADSLSFVIVKDILAAGAFDEAVMGVNGLS